MLVAVVGSESGGGRLLPLADDGTPAGPLEVVDDLAAAMRRAPESTRWVWSSWASLYPRLLRQGVRVERCHDVELTEALLLGHAGRWGEPHGLAAIRARLHGEPVPADPGVAPMETEQRTLFDELPTAFDPLAAVVEAYQDQVRRLPDHRFRLLVAAESAGGLLGGELGHTGLPWRVDIHDAVLRELLGDPPPGGGHPPRLTALAEAINAAFGERQVNPDSPAEILKAFGRAGITLPSTRAWVLQQVDHPAVPLLLEYKELYRIWTAHGWNWCAQWVRAGRFHAEFVPGGVVSGRWATRGGGALQVPKVVRRAVVADEGWTFVVADAGQLEPRVLAAMAGDAGLAAAGRAGDLYRALADEAFGGDRAKAKVALLGAMYGQTGGAAVPALAALRARFPVAWEFVEQAARRGEAGGLVRSWLGRTCPPGRPVTGEQARSRGRFTRNFVVQATAAEWALALLASLRLSLPPGAELVFFVHDEFVIHAPRAVAADAARAVTEAAAAATRLLFGDTVVRFPLDISTVECYADAK